MTIEFIDHRLEDFRHFRITPTIELIQEITQQTNDLQNVEISVGIGWFDFSLWVIWNEVRINDN